MGPRAIPRSRKCSSGWDGLEKGQELGQTSPGPAGLWNGRDLSHPTPKGAGQIPPGFLGHFCPHPAVLSSPCPLFQSRLHFPSRSIPGISSSQKPQKSKAPTPAWPCHSGSALGKFLGLHWTKPSWTRGSSEHSGRGKRLEIRPAWGSGAGKPRGGWEGSAGNSGNAAGQVGARRGQMRCRALGRGTPAEPPKIPAESRDGGGQSDASLPCAAPGFFTSFHER